MNEKSKASRKGKREKNIIDFNKCVCFYEDSENDLNVVSEDEDLKDAGIYVQQKQKKALKLNIVPQEFYEQIRREQMTSDLNQSALWHSSTIHNQFSEETKAAKKALK